MRTLRVAVLVVAACALVATTYNPWPNYAFECERDADCVVAFDVDHSGPGQRWAFFEDGGECLTGRAFTQRYFGEHDCLVEHGKPARGGCPKSYSGQDVCTVAEWPVQGAVCERSICRVRLADGGLW